MTAEPPDEVPASAEETQPVPAPAPEVGMFGDPVEIAGQQVYPCHACSTATAVVTVPAAELENHRVTHLPAPAEEPPSAAGLGPAAPPPPPMIGPFPGPQPYYSAPAPAPAKPTNATGPNWKILGPLAAVVVIAAIVIAVVVHQTAKMSVNGTFDFSGDHAADCSTGTGGYDDINDTTQVTISADGKVLAVTDLGVATVGSDDCLYGFTLDGVSKHHSIYTVEVSHRGGISFTKSQVEAGDVGLTLG